MGKMFVPLQINPQVSDEETGENVSVDDISYLAKKKKQQQTAI